MAHKQWAGRAVANARAIVATWLPTTCPRCGQPVTPDQAWNIDHIPGRDQLHPTEWFNPAYWHASHRHCDAQAGARYGNHKRAAQKRANQTKRRQAADIATHTPAAPHLIHQISGPPCAGKTTWITQHAQPEDLVLDDNQLAQQHGGRDRIPQHAWAKWRHDRATHITTWTGPGRLWFTQGDPTPHSPGIHVHLIDPGPTECHARADRDGRPAATHDWINTWYTKHGDSSGEDGTPTHEAPFLGAARQSRARTDILPPSAREWPEKGPYAAAEATQHPTWTDSTQETRNAVYGASTDFGVWHAVPWVAPLIAAMRPEDVWPRLMTAPHPRAVGSYGPAAIARIEARRAADPMVPAHEKPLRFFQRLIVARAYEHDADGCLVWETVLQTTNRQVGKSVLVRETAIDRGWHADRLGEEQLVVHLARDLSVAEEVQRPARAWARWMRQDGGDPRFKAIDTNGKAEVRGPGFRWVSRSEKGAYGWSASMAPADECWDIEPGTIHNGLEPTMAARREPQLWLLSTSHESCTALFPEYRNQALAELDAPGALLLVEWSAPPDADETDPAAWRAASPWFDDRRRDLIGKKVGSRGFREQWLNIWPGSATRVQAEPLVDAARWGALRQPVPPGARVSGVGVESAPGGLPVVAEARRGDDGRVWVSVREAGSMAQAAAWCRDAGVAPRVGKSLLHDPVWADAGAVPKTQTSADAASVFRQLVVDGVLEHDGSDVLAVQVSSTLMAASSVGWRVSSQGRTDALKAVVWAVEDARQAVSWFAY